MPWDNDFKEYAVKIAGLYLRDPSGTLKSLCYGSVHGSLNESYLSLVKEKELTPIDELPVNEKVRLWNQSKMYGTDKKQCIEISRSIYLLEQLTK